MNISQDLLKTSCFHDYTHLMDLFLRMSLKVCFSAEGEDNENNNYCGGGSDQ